MTYKTHNIYPQPLNANKTVESGVINIGDQNSNQTEVDTSSLDIFPNLPMLADDNRVHLIGIPLHVLYQRRSPTIAEQVRDMRYRQQQRYGR